MPNVLVNDESLSAIGSAIRNKNGSTDTYKPSEMAQAIDNIPQSGFVEAPDNDVIFIDIYGNRLYSYTYEESKNLTELPPLPTDEDVEFDRWNWSLEDFHNNNIYKTNIVVGPIPKIGDYELYIWVDIQKERYDSIKFEFSYNGSNSFYVDWGDGVTENITGRQIAHTYNMSGIYKIHFDFKNTQSNSINSLIVGNSYLDKWEKFENNTEIRKYIKKAISGDRVGFNLRFQGATEYYYNGKCALEYSGTKSIVVRENTSDSITLNESGKLKYISIPFRNHITHLSCQYDISLEKIMVPVDTTSVNFVGLGFDVLDISYIDRFITFNGSNFRQYPVAVKVPAKYFQLYYDNFISSIPNSIVPIGNYLNDIKSYKSLFNSTTKIEAEYISSDNIIPTITITSSNPDAVEFSNIIAQDGKIEFDLITKEIEDKVTITLNANFDGELFTKEFVVNIKESFPLPTYTVEDVSGASYNFVLNSNGYYESTNKAIQNSASVCKVTFNNAEGANITFNCINYAETNYDYGIIGQPNVELTLNNTDDGATGTTKVLKNFKGLSTATVQQFTYNSLENDFFVYIKYRKDSSGDSNNDSFQFNIEFS